MPRSRTALALESLAAAGVLVALLLLPVGPVSAPDPSAEDLVLLACRAVALLCTARLAVTGAACLVAAGRPVPRGFGLLVALAPARFRRIAGLAASGAAAISLTAGAPASARVDVPVVRAPVTSVARTPDTTAPPAVPKIRPAAAPSIPGPPTTVRPPTPTRPVLPRPPRPTATTTVHTVRPGDHLWGITRAVLGERLGREPTAAEIVPLWRAVIAANTARLRSGDPALVFPGEQVVVPPSPGPEPHR